MIAGIDHVKSDALVIIDADLQDPPELIQEMISYWEDGYDDVYARRNNRQGETWLKKNQPMVLQNIAEIDQHSHSGRYWRFSLTGSPVH